MKEDKKVIIYCDESGNSGPNYLDQEQPFYVLASWVVPYSRIADVAAEVELHRQRFARQSEELKAYSLVKTRRGKKALISLIRSLGQLDCIPLYEVLEKRYCVAGKIVETFLDPMYNPKVANAFIPDSTTKQEIANTLYEELPRDVLNRFAAVYRNPSLKEFENSLSEITSALRSNVGQELANLIEGCRPQIKEIAEIEASVAFDGNMEATLNFPVLIGMLMMIEVCGRLNLIEPVKLVHDEIYAYQKGFKKLFKTLLRADDGVFIYPNASIVVFPLRNIPEFEFGDSKNTNIIQAADVLASSINYLAKCALQSKKVTKLDIELASLLFPSLLIEVPRIAWSVGSNHWVQALGAYYFTPLFEQQPENTHQKTLSKTKWYKSLPLLPSRKHIIPKSDTVPKRAFPMPVYGLIGEKSHSLMCVNDLDIPKFPDEAAVLLFSSKENARKFIEKWKEHSSFDEEQEIYSYGPGDVRQLVEHLEFVQKYSRLLIIDLGTEKVGLLELNNTVNSLKSSMDRIARAITSGIIKEMFKIHEVNGIQIMSYLTSDGSYLAGIYPNGKLHKGKSRDEAVDAVKKAEI